MIEVNETVSIACPPDRVLDFVMDIERYAEVDTKIRPVLWSRRDGDVVEFACRPRLAGLRQPAVVQYAELTPGRRIDISLCPRPCNQLAHAVARFTASVVCDEAAGGTTVTRNLRFEFHPPFRRLLEPLFRRRLAAEVRDELARAKEYLEP